MALMVLLFSELFAFRSPKLTSRAPKITNEFVYIRLAVDVTMESEV